MRKTITIAVLALGLAGCGPKAPAYISELTDCAELSSLWDDADRDFDAAYATGDSENMDRARAVMDATLARMENLGC